MARLEAAYGKGKWCEDPAKPEACLNIDEITEDHGDVTRRETAARGLGRLAHDCAADEEGLRALRRAVEQRRERAGVCRHRRDVARRNTTCRPTTFTKELDRLWDQVRPLYLKLHAYVRMKLHEKYGDVVPGEGPDSAHLLGNIWAQDWQNVYPLVGAGERRRRATRSTTS